jgi:hypothetical protein
MPASALAGCNGSKDQYVPPLPPKVTVAPVRKLYSEAELPTFACETPRPDQLSMTYRSTRPFAALAEGLIRGCIAHYGEPIEVGVEDLSDEAGTAALFLLTRKAAP